MRSVSAALNRVFLAFFGLLIVCAAAWFLASGLDAGHSVPSIAAYLAAAQDEIGALLSLRAHWLLPLGVLMSVITFVVGLFLLLMQVPRRPANSSLRLSGSDGTLLATLSPDVLSQALSERAQGVPGIEGCTVFVTGSPSKLWVQAETSVAPDCEVEWTVTELRKLLNEDVATSLGTPPKQLDVLVRLARSASSTSTSKAVTGQPSSAITGTGTGA
ncbi:hypothetical protein QP415_09090 [Pauljensenia sp. UMB3104]|uniref:hypothetical protein n=1 Tax=Pauljensenia sp. UMB3104 TaxID=3046331 RepID=UPI00092C38EC|nr:hypothetical protein [Pauljensenia sp. UMB3104]MDK7160007.1 hypothetical protein [Pauljensenia sp. UMB3104]SIA36741.1 Uncharacterised protein [Mycobacteroides abscessus subsp. abscessus]